MRIEQVNRALDAIGICLAIVVIGFVVYESWTAYQRLANAHNACASFDDGKVIEGKFRVIEDCNKDRAENVSPG